MNQYDHLKNKLHQYKVDIDKQKLWEQTSHAIPRKKRRGAVLMLLLAGLFISGRVWYTTSWPPFSEIQFSLHSVQSNNTASPEPHHQTETAETLTHTHESFVSTMEPNASINSHEGQILVFTPQPQISGSQSTSNIEIEDSFSVYNKEHDDVLVAKNSLVLSSVILTDNLIGKEDHANVTFITDQQKNSKDFTTLLHKELNATNQFYNLSVSYMLKDVSPIPPKTQEVIATTSHIPIMPAKKAPILQSIQLVQSVGLSRMSIRSLNPASVQVAEQMEQKLKSLEILSTAVTASIRLPEKFSIVTGIQWKQLATVIEHDWQSAERLEMEGVTQIVIGRNGIPEMITGNTEFTRIHTIKGRRFTSHEQIDISVALHREIWNTRRLSLHGFIKGIYNLTYTAKGSTLNNEGALYSFVKNDNPFQQLAPLAIGGGLQMSYRFAAKWNFISNISFDPLHFELRQQHTSIGFQHSGYSLGFGIGHIF